MKKSCLLAMTMLLFMGCDKNTEEKALPLAVEKLQEEHNRNLPAVVPVDDLTLESLVGTWLLLDSEARIDMSGDHLTIEKIGSGYSGVLVYQGHKKSCVAVVDGDVLYVSATSGEKYKVSRISSMYQNEDNGIGLALITGFDDIGLGFFQRKDILEKLKLEK